MRDLVIREVKPGDWDGLNENLKVIAAALNENNADIAALLGQKLGPSETIGDDKSTTTG